MKRARSITSRVQIVRNRRGRCAAPSPSSRWAESGGGRVPSTGRSPRSARSSCATFCRAPASVASAGRRRGRSRSAGTAQHRPQDRRRAGHPARASERERLRRPGPVESARRRGSSSAGRRRAAGHGCSARKVITCSPTWSSVGVHPDVGPGGGRSGDGTSGPAGTPGSRSNELVVERPRRRGSGSAAVRPRP